MAVDDLTRQKARLRERVAAGQVLYIFLDPDGSQEPMLGVVLERSTGVVYSHQCAGIRCEERFVEGAFVPLGGRRYDDEGRLDIGRLTACFHRDVACTGDYDQPLGRLAAEVSQVAYWNSDIADDDKTTRTPLELDYDRRSEIAEGWVPVLTAHGRGILIFDNCD